MLGLAVQVSLAIRGGYVPEKFQNSNTKTGILAKLAKICSFSPLFAVFSSRIVKTANAKTKNNENRLYQGYQVPPKIKKAKFGHKQL